MKVSIWFVRMVFVVLAVIVAIYMARQIFPAPELQEYRPIYDLWAALAGLAAAAVVLVLDIVFQKKSVAVIVAICLGLIAGTLFEVLVTHVISLSGLAARIDKDLWPWIEISILVLLCYVAISIILQTREDFRFVIPYVKFSQEGGSLPFVLDTSVIIDGRIADIADTGVMDNTLVVPRFVLNELQGIADSADRLKRNRGRRGLDVLNRLQKCPRLSVEIRDMFAESAEAVDTKLIRMAKAIKGRVVTNDFNLNKIAQLQEVEVVNINDLAQALRPVVLPGEDMEVKIIRAGEEPGQGVGYLEDGTMVVVEQGRDLIGQKVPVTVNNVYQTSAGRMIFGKHAASVKPASLASPKNPGPTLPGLPGHSVSVVVAAGGEGRRMRSELRKPWLSVAGEPVVVHTLRRFARLEITREIILVVHPEDVVRANDLVRGFPALWVTPGGESRVASVRAGLARVSPDAQLIAIQDGVRPLVDEELILRTCRAAFEWGAAVPVIPVSATLKEVPAPPAKGDPDARWIVRTVPRENLCEAQTPQVFRADLIRRAYAALADADVTDDAQAVERLGERVAAVPGSVHNIKITTPDDLKLAEMLLGR
jgi:2-C-methyl-D-erythritol 4-phosphate cytidylyltransferase